MVASFNFCPECGIKKVSLDKFCRHCGHEDQSQNTPSETKSSTDSREVLQNEEQPSDLSISEELPPQPTPGLPTTGLPKKRPLEIAVWGLAILCGLFVAEGLFNSFEVTRGFMEYNCGTPFESFLPGRDVPTACSLDNSFSNAITKFNLAAIGLAICVAVAFFLEDEGIAR
jgi:hypothetical protein